ncbi:MAG: phosphate ABC transporter permease PstA [Spirochaetaceae bacterium]|jgi:phosphate transport system permease protein|nr:phosphate ABC transporter permease PstA [Spirochaetaceae bacterium]
MNRNTVLIKRKTIDTILYGIMAAALSAVCVLLLCILFYILKSAAGYVSVSFIFRSAQEGGVFPMIVTTVYVVLASLAIALPAGIMTAIFFHEYSGGSRGIRWLRLAVETLAGIPSILYGLFGLILFCRFFRLGQSIIAGAFTLSIMILPVIIRTVEETLKTIPDSFREASLSLGATKLQTITRIVIPEALPGILTAGILAAGRVLGESAPVLLTVGIARNIPKSIFDSGRTLTIHLYYLTKEAVNPDDFGVAFATAAVLIILIVIINTTAKLVTLSFRKKLGGGI